MGKNKSERTFSQSFFLAPQENGYFVLNDFFRFVDNEPLENRLVNSGSLQVRDPSAPSTATLVVDQDNDPNKANNSVNFEELFNEKEKARAESMDNSCAVCAETLEWVAYGPCGHREVCSACILRLRIICNNRCCCICKSESNIIFVTKSLGDYTSMIGDFSAFPPNPIEGQAGQYWFHEGAQAYFDDVDYYKKTKNMCKLSCNVCDRKNEERNGGSKEIGGFDSIEQLKIHLFRKHKLFICSLCLEGRKAASRNDYDDLEMHFRQGHFLCEHEACLAKKFVVFAAESEMKTHNATEHGGPKSRSESNVACHIPTSIWCQRIDGQAQTGSANGVCPNSSNIKISMAIQDSQEAFYSVRFPGISLLSEDFLVTHNQVLSSTCNQIPEQKTASSLLDESSFPPLPVAPSSSGQRSRNTRSINTVDSSIKKIATHKSHRNTVEVLNSSRALAPPPSCQPDSSMSCLSRPVLDSKLSSPSNSPSFSQNKLATNDNLSSSNVSSTQSRSSTANDLVLSLNIANSLRNRSSFCNVNRSSTAPNLVERENFDKTMSNSQVNKKGTTSRHPVLKVENVQTANKALVEKICATLDFDKDKFDAFKVISVEYRQDIIDTAEYLAYVGQFGLAHLVPELAVLCPTQKQRELVEMYYLTTMRNSSNENGSSIDDGGQKSKESSKKGKEKREDD